MKKASFCLIKTAGYHADPEIRPTANAVPFDHYELMPKLSKLTLHTICFLTWMDEQFYFDIIGIVSYGPTGIVMFKVMLTVQPNDWSSLSSISKY